MHRIHNTKSPRFSPGQILSPLLDREGSSQCLCHAVPPVYSLALLPHHVTGGRPFSCVSTSSGFWMCGSGSSGRRRERAWCPLLMAWHETTASIASVCADAIHANYFQLLLYQSPKFSKWRGWSRALERAFPCRSWGTWSWGSRSDFCCCFAVNSWVQ